MSVVPISKPSQIPTLGTPILVDVAGACRALSISRSTLYRLVGSGDLKPLKVCGATRFRIVDLDALVTRLSEQANAASS